MKLQNICKNIIILQIIQILIDVNEVYGHGRLLDPPSRSSAWRFGFKTQINYNDNELFCGGFTTQWKLNNGKCGICGDPYNSQRDNEVPNGKYAKDVIITRTYSEGVVIEAKVQLTANHNGFFVFKLCPTINDSTEVTQQCLDQFPLEVLNSKTGYKYMVPSKRAETFTIQLKLPNGLTCRRCVFQWTYISANNWGKCDNGSSAVGCGPQETFRGCADVGIVGQTGETNSTANTTRETFKTRQTPELSLYTDKEFSISSDVSTNHFSKPNYSLTYKYLKTKPTVKANETICKSTGIWRRIANMDEWCRTNCAANYCPHSHCICD